MIGHDYLLSVSRNYKIHDQEDLHYLTFGVAGDVKADKHLGGGSQIPV
jgi:hypothetical protein